MIETTGPYGTYMTVQAAKTLSNYVGTGFMQIPTDGGHHAASPVFQTSNCNCTTPPPAAVTRPMPAPSASISSPMTVSLATICETTVSSTNMVTGIAQIGTTGGTGPPAPIPIWASPWASESAYEVGTWSLLPNGTASTSALPAAYDTFIASPTNGSTVVNGIGDAGSSVNMGARPRRASSPTSTAARPSAWPSWPMTPTSPSAGKAAIRVRIQC